MTKSVARIIEDLISEAPMLEDYLARGLINQSALARNLIPEVKKQLGEAPNPQAAMMAIKRYSSRAEKKKYLQDIKKVLGDCTINLKSGVTDIAIELKANLFPLFNDLAKEVKTEKGEVLSFVQGFSEAAIILDDKYADFLLSRLNKSEILIVEKDLVVLYLLAPPKFWVVPGIIAYLTSQISARGVNIVDIVTTQTELSLILKKDDATVAFDTINRLIEESKTK